MAATFFVAVFGLRKRQPTGTPPTPPPESPVVRLVTNRGEVAALFREHVDRVGSGETHHCYSPLITTGATRTVRAARRATRKLFRRLRNRETASVLRVNAHADGSPTHLTNGHTYTCTVTATNATGIGPASDASNMNGYSSASLSRPIRRRALCRLRLLRLDWRNRSVPSLASL